MENKELVERCNDLAWCLAERDGIVAGTCHKFYLSPQDHIDIKYWHMAVTAFDFIEGVDVEKALAEME